MSWFKLVIRNIIIVLLFAWGISDANTQPLGFYLNEREKAIIPFEEFSNLIVLQVALNDSFPVNMILDTGVRPTILLDDMLARKMGAKFTRAVSLSGIGGRNVEAHIAKNINLSFGKVRSKDLSVLVLGQRIEAFSSRLGVKIDGIIGYDLFSRFVVKIDYDKNRIVLYEPGSYKSPHRYKSVDVMMERGKPYVWAKALINAQKSMDLKLLFDTGASHVLMLDASSDAMIQLSGPSISSTLGHGLAGEIHGQIGRIKEFEMGTYKLKNVITALYQTKESAFDNREVFRHGSIGGELMGRFMIVVDYYHHKIYLRPNANFKKSFVYNMSGIEILASGENYEHYLIQHVRLGSAAAKAGFKQGDMIYSINNSIAKNINLKKVYTLLNKKEGRKITLTVVRNGQFYTRTFSLEREI